MIAQFKRNLCKNFSPQGQSKCDENDTLQKRYKFWLNVIDTGSPILHDVFNYDYNDGVEYFVGGERHFPDTREIKNC